MPSLTTIARRLAQPTTGSSLILAGAMSDVGGQAFHAFVAACPVSRKLIGPEILRLNYKTSANILAAATVLMDDAGGSHATSLIYDQADPSLPVSCALWRTRVSQVREVMPEIFWVDEPAPEPRTLLTLRVTLEFALARADQPGDQHLDALAGHLCAELVKIVGAIDAALTPGSGSTSLRVELDHAGCVEVLCSGFVGRFSSRASDCLAMWKRTHGLRGLDGIDLATDEAAGATEAA